LDSLRREMLRSAKTEELEKGPSSEQDKTAEKDRAVMDLFPEVQDKLLSKYELLPVFHRRGALFGFYSSAVPSAYLFMPRNGALGRRGPTFVAPTSGLTRNSFQLGCVPETEASSFWLQGAGGYRRAAGPGFKDVIDWKRFYDDFERDAYWRHKSLMVVPEPQGLFLAVFLIPVPLLLLHRARSCTRSAAKPSPPKSR